ncbi:MAG: GntR family transcriptional regulator [Clostridiales bacterium]|nr:GntR family transcriptional regulator [Clostridiales bacterium]
MFLVNPKSKQPLYEQLVEQLRRQLVLGVVKAGEAMPSVRQLATELGINPNTIQKAYRRMEDEGMIVSVPGRGSFVSEDLAGMLEKQRADQLKQTLETLRACRELGLSKEAVASLVEQAYEEGDVC